MKDKIAILQIGSIACRLDQYVVTIYDVYQRCFVEIWNDQYIHFCYTQIQAAVLRQGNCIPVYDERAYTKFFILSMRTYFLLVLSRHLKFYVCIVCTFLFVYFFLCVCLFVCFYLSYSGPSHVSSTYWITSNSLCIITHIRIYIDTQIQKQRCK